ncbi:hypothetical protein OXX69_003149 [Metschnikowia pulcherrima]
MNMIISIAILAAVVACMSIENSFNSDNLLTSKPIPAQQESSIHQAAASKKHWFFDAPLGGRAPEDCDFTGMLVTNPEHMRLVEAHPQYIACQLKQAKEAADHKKQRQTQELSEAVTGKAVSFDGDANRMEEVKSNSQAAAD